MRNEILLKTLVPLKQLLIGLCSMDFRGSLTFSSEGLRLSILKPVIYGLCDALLYLEARSMLLGVLNIVSLISTFLSGENP